MKKFIKNKLNVILPIVLILIILFLGYSQKIDLTNSDIGRHIINGQIFLEEGKIISTNFYSYTQQNYPTINHHWLYGVFMYFIWKNLGFIGLSFINIILYLITFLLFFLIAKEKGNTKLAIISSILVIPLLIYRKEVRPEVFSYLFFALELFLLTKFENKKINYKTLFSSLIIIQIIWINTHIFFIFGIALTSFFLIQNFINKSKKYKQYLYLLIGIIFASTFNPHFIKGLIQPFLIFKNYGYLLAENMNLIFIQLRTHNPLYLYIEFILIIGIISFFISRKNPKNNLTNILLFLFFGTLTLKMVRNITIFGFIMIPILSENFKEIYNKISKNNKQIIFILSILILIIIFSLTIFQANQERGFGLKDQTQDSIKFFKENNLEGPIFNNYDLGGYLIFNLFPKGKIFIDNRPEAYPEEFFTEIYIPMQENDTLWKEFEKKYKFNLIYFNRNDLTPWGQNFIISRFKDKTWIPVYVDNSIIIFLKDNEKNKELIEKFRLPDSMFKITRLN